MSACALIPARGGSKRLPRKNVLDFGGRPMLVWTIEAALASGEFADVVVSTDDDEIAAVGAAAGARVVRRPATLADDETGLIAVMRHALEAGLSAHSALCLLLPNCPLRTAADVRASAVRFRLERPNALLSVVEYLWTPPFRALAHGPTGLEPLFGDWVRRKSQAYPWAVCPSGALYWSTPAVLDAAVDLYVPGVVGFELPWQRGIDIDTRADFEIASALRLAIDCGFEFTN